MANNEGPPTSNYTDTTSLNSGSTTKINLNLPCDREDRTKQGSQPASRQDSTSSSTTWVSSSDTERQNETSPRIGVHFSQDTLERQRNGLKKQASGQDLSFYSGQAEKGIPPPPTPLSKVATLGDGSDGWTKLDKVFRQFDEGRIQDCKEDMDTLLVFAGLFSAVLTAFVIQSYQLLQQNSVDITATVLLQISQQLNSFSLNAGFVNSTQPPLPPTASPIPFQVQPSSIRVNILWFASLVFSLVTASLGMLVKQWLREYSASDCLSPQQRTRIRHYRHRGLTTWKVFEIAAILPVLLQIALALFFIGLTDFVLQLHPVVGWIITALIILWFILYFATTLAPVFSPICPYKTPLLRTLLKRARELFYSQVAKLLTTFTKLRFTDIVPVDEETAIAHPSQDAAVIKSADRTFQADELLDIYCQCLANMPGPDVLECAAEFLSRRSAQPIIIPITKPLVLWPRGSSDGAWSSSIHCILDAMNRESSLLQRRTPGAVGLPAWLRDGLLLLDATIRAGDLEKDNAIRRSLDEIVIKLLLSDNDILRQDLVKCLGSMRNWCSLVMMGHANVTHPICNDKDIIKLTRSFTQISTSQSMSPDLLCWVILVLAVRTDSDTLQRSGVSRVLDSLVLSMQDFSMDRLVLFRCLRLVQTLKDRVPGVFSEEFDRFITSNKYRVVVLV